MWWCEAEVGTKAGLFLILGERKKNPDTQTTAVASARCRIIKAFANALRPPKDPVNANQQNEKSPKKKCYY